jgi:hypothetical protein
VRERIHLFVGKWKNCGEREREREINVKPAGETI